MHVRLERQEDLRTPRGESLRCGRYLNNSQSVLGVVRHLTLSRNSLITSRSLEERALWHSLAVPHEGGTAGNETGVFRGASG